MAETLNIEARTPDVLKGNSIEESFLKNLDADLAIWSLMENYCLKVFKFNKKRIYKYSCINFAKLERGSPIQKTIINLIKKLELV